MKFFIKCIPPKSTAQASNRILRRKDGSMFVGKMQSSKGKQTESDLLTLLAPHVPVKPLDCPLDVFVSWRYPYRKAEPKKNRTRPIPCDTRPDVDNLQKLLFDCMTRLGFWHDDSQVARITFEKLWCEQPCILIRIREAT
jgi:Holliday junction resolvase RusA-like endonuclease